MARIGLGVPPLNQARAEGLGALVDRLGIPHAVDPRQHREIRNMTRRIPKGLGISSTDPLHQPLAPSIRLSLGRHALCLRVVLVVVNLDLSVQLLDSTRLDPLAEKFHALDL